MKFAPLLVAAIIAAIPLASAAAVIELPAAAVLRSEETSPVGTYAMPIGPWQENGGIKTLPTSGAISRRAWRIAGTAKTSAQIMADLRDQLVREGYDILFECETKSCGGFDFRYGTEVIGEPDMHVNLGDFRFLAAEKPPESAGDAPNYASLLVSRTPSAAFVQMIEVGKAVPAPDGGEVTASTKAVPGSALPAEIATDIGSAMEGVGRFVLGDLVFATGSSELGPGDFSSLEELAKYLLAHPDKKVALVGHTDAEGSLAGNISLSKRRAVSVMNRLIDKYGVPPAQLEAEGIGYLAPIASNQTEDGRARNRRVEAILISTK